MTTLGPAVIIITLIMNEMNDGDDDDRDPHHRHHNLSLGKQSRAHSIKMPLPTLFRDSPAVSAGLS